MKRFIMVLCCLLTIKTVNAGIVYDLDQSRSDVISDFDVIAQWMSDNIAEGTARASTAGTHLPANVCRLTGFGFGFSVGLDIWDLEVNKFRALNTRTIVTDNTGRIDLPSKIAFPAGFAHFKVGLPGGFDLGAKYGENSATFKKGNSDFKTASKIYGVELRKHIFGRSELSGLLLPDISINLSVDGIDGYLRKTEVYTLTTAEVYNGNNYDQTVNTDYEWNSKWNAGQVGLRGVISKKLVLLTPFAGIGIGKNFGETVTTITNNGRITLDPDFGPNQSIALSSVNKKKSKSDDISFNYNFGVEFNLLLLNVGANYYASKDTRRIYLQARFQFR